MLCASALTACGGEAAREKEAAARAARLSHPEVRYGEKVSPALAFSLGFLPFGVAGMYVNDWKLAGTGLLWPFSVMWAPQKAYDAAIDINRSVFEQQLFNALEKPSEPGPRLKDEDDEP